MGRYTIAALRVVIALSLAGSLIVQVGILPLLWNDLSGAEHWQRTLFVGLIALGSVSLQACAVCIWQLLTLVRRDAVFSPRSFLYVDVIAASIGVSSLVLFVLAALMAEGEAAPGFVGIIGGFGLVAAGLVLLVLVMRTLLTKATQLRSELDEVV